ncbi:MAG: hypothetical protein FWE34_09525 [Defluviitaleaceae bacterium]|nr:hypothetical protein [Defluviitaleaceae bacterium]
MPKLNRRTATFKITAAALLTAIGILIPMVSPLRIVIEPASYTLASHVAIFIAMFISPKVALVVTLGTTLGFFLGGFPPTIVVRAASHIVFVVLGSMYLQKIDKFNMSFMHLRIFSLVMALIHGAFEFVAVMLLYFGTNVPITQETFIFFVTMVGAGTVVHSIVDLEIANVVRLALQKQPTFRELTS